MAEEFITPRVRAMLICDSFEHVDDENVYHLFGVRYVLEAIQFPFVPSTLCAFVMFSCARKGKYSGVISIVSEQDDKIHYMYEFEIVFDVDGEFLCECLPINCRFPRPGQYQCVLSFLQPALEKVDMIKAETPFWVIDQGD